MCTNITFQLITIPVSCMFLMLYSPLSGSLARVCAAVAARRYFPNLAYGEPMAVVTEATVAAVHEIVLVIAGACARSAAGGGMSRSGGGQLRPCVWLRTRGRRLRPRRLRRRPAERRWLDMPRGGACALAPPLGAGARKRSPTTRAVRCVHVLARGTCLRVKCTSRRRVRRERGRHAGPRRRRRRRRRLAH